jgi:murein DD-endopeptidase MepM/ murein hydrolase activator NlpD
MKRRKHVVVNKDTLGEISERYGVSISDLKKINQIDNINKLKIGQVIYLDKEDVLGFQVLFIDNDRNPLMNQNYFLEFSGRMIKGRTGSDGLTVRILTESPFDIVKIGIERLDKSVKVVAQVISGYGNKLVEIKTPRIKAESKTEPHPSTVPNKIPDKSERPSPIFPQNGEKKPTNNKEEPGINVTPTKTADGKPVAKVEGNIPNWDFLDNYSGEVMTDDDYVWAAKELGVEKPAIKAFAVVESGGSGFFVLGKKTVPKILYERHKFAAFTKNKYSKNHPDISLPNAYYNNKAKYVPADEEYKKKKGIDNDINYYRPVGKKDSKEIRDRALSLKDLLAAGKATAQNDKYLDGAGSYKRLIKAYQLDPDAALKSCSWGAFQIMGEYWDTMKYSSPKNFTKSISMSPKEQIKSFVAYIKYVNPRIKKHLKNLDWVETARAYNGPGFKDYNYDVKLEAAYKKFKDEK